MIFILSELIWCCISLICNIIFPSSSILYCYSLVCHFISQIISGHSNWFVNFQDTNTKYFNYLKKWLFFQMELNISLCLLMLLLLLLLLLLFVLYNTLLVYSLVFIPHSYWCDSHITNITWACYFEHAFVYHILY